jgi:hypothetical protein
MLNPEMPVTSGLSTACGRLESPLKGPELSSSFEAFAVLAWSAPAQVAAEKKEGAPSARSPARCRRRRFAGGFDGGESCRRCVPLGSIPPLRPASTGTAKSPTVRSSSSQPTPNTAPPYT